MFQSLDKLSHKQWSKIEVKLGLIFENIEYYVYLRDYFSIHTSYQDKSCSGMSQ